MIPVFEEIIEDARIEGRSEGIALGKDIRLYVMINDIVSWGFVDLDILLQKYNISKEEYYEKCKKYGIMMC